MFGLSNMNQASRCLARTRRGTPCQCSATKGRARCRIHGGATGSGGPKGARNGAFRHGGDTVEAVAARRAVANLNQAWRDLSRKVQDAKV